MFDDSKPYGSVISIHDPVGSPEINCSRSMTIPDMTLTVKELYHRYRLGTLPVDLVRDVLYDECDDFDSVLAEHLPSYDLVDYESELVKLRQKFELMHKSSQAATPSKAAESELAAPETDEPNE